MTTHFIWTFSDALLAALLLVVGIGLLGEQVARKFYRRKK
jgi:hypothetical protein